MEKTPDHIAYRLLSRSHPPEAASDIFTEKVLRKPLSLRPTSPDPTSKDARAVRRLQRLRKKEHARRRQRPKPLSARERRVLGIYDIPRESQRYEIYVPLHRLWLGYMREVLGMEGGKHTYLTAQSVGSKLASADFHGAELEVVRSKCVGRVGCRGIVLKDTKFTFEVITKQNTMRSAQIASLPLSALV
jgi:ribonuclease P protein subunit POP4